MPVVCPWPPHHQPLISAYLYCFAAPTEDGIDKILRCPSLTQEYRAQFAALISRIFI